jgi:serine/threonine-protein kinase
MSPDTHSPLPVVLRSGSATHEEGRVFLQRRLGVFGGWVFAISGGFILLNIIGILAGPMTDAVSLVSAGSLFHALATLTVGGVWVIACGRPRATPTLEWVDAAGVTLACLFFGMMGGALVTEMSAIGFGPAQGLNTALLACVFTVVTRAIAVPSTPRRTIWISVAAMAPLVLLVAPSTLRTAWNDPQLVLLFTIELAAWSVAAVAVAAVGSRIIFGLRVEAAKGRRLGQYTLEEKIGEGGMGEVYRARHLMLRRPTAIKLLPPDKAGEDNVRRFEREVQLTSQLCHPSTVVIFDYGRTPLGVFYYAMELLDGLNLEQLVTSDGPQPAGRVIRILAQVCGALAEAHGVGLIHRDIKPGNIILSERGGVADVATVVDFGLVKQLDPGDADATQMVTSTSIITGTPLYVAPEVIRGGQAIDGRSDLYALGAVGYFLLTGHPVFHAETVVEIFAHHLHSPPAPLGERTRGPVPDGLERLILSCLAKDPDDRPASARALADALGDCPSGQDWDESLATAWWAQYQGQTAAVPIPKPRQAAGRPTLDVDLGSRE